MAKVKLSNVRLSFPELWEARQFQAGVGKARYDSTFLVEKGSANDKAVRAAISEAATETWGAKATAQLKALSGDSGKFCYQNGDLKEYDGYEGHMALSSHRNADQGPPAIVDRMKNKLTINDGKPYAGCYVNASVDIWVQQGKYPGVRCTLVGVQFVADGDAFAGAAATDDAFDDLGDDSTEGASEEETNWADEEVPQEDTEASDDEFY